eukprot:g681.t1
MDTKDDNRTAAGAGVPATERADTAKKISHDDCQMTSSSDSFFTENLRNAAFDGNLADVTLRCVVEEGKGRETDVPFSRILLAAQSPVFRNMLFGNMRESEPHSIVPCHFPPRVVRRGLEYMCTGKILVDRSNAVELYAFSNFYQIERLEKMCHEYIQSHMESEATIFLGDAKRMRLEELESTCWNCLKATPSVALTGTRVCELSREDLRDLIASDDLNIDEIEAYRSIVRWYKSRGQKDAVDLKSLMEVVRFPLIPPKVLAEEIVDDGLAPQELLFEALVHHHRSSPSPSKLSQRNPHQYLRRHVERRIEYEKSANESRGIFYFIGTRKHSKSFTNPIDLPAHERVIATSVGLSRGKVRDFVGMSHPPCNCYCRNYPDAWMEIDIGENRLIAPDRYALRYGSSNTGYFLRSWNLEARRSKETPWTVLRSHRDDSSLNGEGWPFASWPVETRQDDNERGYRFFRIHITGENSAGDFQLVCSGIELWGEYLEFLSGEKCT